MRNRSLVVTIFLLGVIVIPGARAQQSRLIVRDTSGTDTPDRSLPPFGMQCFTRPGRSVASSICRSSGHSNRSRQLAESSSASIGNSRRGSGPVGESCNSALELHSLKRSRITCRWTITALWHGTATLTSPPIRSLGPLKRRASTRYPVQASSRSSIPGSIQRIPALASVLLPGYDFTSNSVGADETGGLDHSTVAVLDSGTNPPVYVNPSAGVDGDRSGGYGA